MKVIVIGGAGVFGQRLSEMLLRDGHDVTIMGRSDRKTQAAAAMCGASTLILDRSGDLAALWACAPDVVIDAAGPFHAYGADPYRLPRQAIVNGCHYIDLADDAAFCAGIGQLDQAARAAGVFVLSGASSVPAISSAVVASLTKTRPIDLIETAILPGNRAPRGKAVVDSILHQVGTQIEIPEAGAVVHVRSWSRPKMFALGDGVRRKGYMIRVPDQSLFPTAFEARSVTFYASLELRLMAEGLAALSWLRATTGLRVPTRVVHWLADRLAKAGTQTGGMIVRVVAGGVQDRWQLIVTDGHGPYIPGVVARAVLRAPQLPGAGARPAINVISRAAIEAALTDLSTEIRVDTTQPLPLFQTALGGSFDDLPAAVRDTHAVIAPLRLAGRARITRGNGWFPRLVAWMFRFPKATDDVDVTVVKTPDHTAERWERRFGNDRFFSVLRQGKNGMTEQFGPFTFDLGLRVAQNALHFPVKAGRFLGIPMPRWLLPISRATETAQDGLFHFDVALFAPLTGQLVVHYQGHLSPQQDDGA